jgi:hypothetical protein
MKAKLSDRICKDYRVYLEPVLTTACAYQATVVGVRTMSRYIRMAVVYMLKTDGYPLDKVTRKFLSVKAFHKGVSS